MKQHFSCFSLGVLRWLVPGVCQSLAPKWQRRGHGSSTKRRSCLGVRLRISEKRPRCDANFRRLKTQSPPLEKRNHAHIGCPNEQKNNVFFVTCPSSAIRFQLQRPFAPGRLSMNSSSNRCDSFGIKLQILGTPPQEDVLNSELTAGVVLAAAQRNGWALAFAAPELQADKASSVWKFQWHGYLHERWVSSSIGLEHIIIWFSNSRRLREAQAVETQQNLAAPACCSVASLQCSPCRSP